MDKVKDAPELVNWQSSSQFLLHEISPPSPSSLSIFFDSFPVPIYTLGGEERHSVLAQEHNTTTWPGLECRPYNPEPRSLFMIPLHLQLKCWLNSLVTWILNILLCVCHGVQSNNSGKIWLEAELRVFISRMITGLIVSLICYFLCVCWFKASFVISSVPPALLGKISDFSIDFSIRFFCLFCCYVTVFEEYFVLRYLFKYDSNSVGKFITIVLLPILF